MINTAVICNKKKHATYLLLIRIKYRSSRLNTHLRTKERGNSTASSRVQHLRKPLIILLFQIKPDVCMVK